jgi:hypothetical protein
MEIILDYLSASNVITMLPIFRRRQEMTKGEGDIMTETGARPQIHS